jgi:hypothetical protein
METKNKASFNVPPTAKKATWKPKKSPWPILSILIFLIAALLFWAALIAVHPEYESALLGGQQTERNFATALVEKAPALASQFPVTVTVPFKTAEGVDSSRDAIVYGYFVNLEGGKCTQFYYPGDIEKSLPQKKACFEPVKQHEPSAFSTAWKGVSSWLVSAWDKIGLGKVGEFYSNNLSGL